MTAKIYNQRCLIIVSKIDKQIICNIINLAHLASVFNHAANWSVASACPPPRHPRQQSSLVNYLILHHTVIWTHPSTARRKVAKSCRLTQPPDSVQSKNSFLVTRELGAGTASVQRFGHRFARTPAWCSECVYVRVQVRVESRFS